MENTQVKNLDFMLHNLKGVVKVVLLPYFNSKELFKFRSLCKHSDALLNPLHKDSVNLDNLFCAIGQYEGMDEDTREKVRLLLSDTGSLKQAFKNFLEYCETPR